MSTQAAGPVDTPLAQVKLGRDVLLHEAQAIERLARRLGNSFAEAVALLAGCRGLVVVTGMGKAGHIGKKVSATLASTGTRSIYLHPAEAVHGDLGRLRPDDVVLAFSQSGETEELLALLPALAQLAVPLVAVTCRAESSLARAAAEVLDLGVSEEACPLGLAPTSSTTAMLALGDALAVVASRMQGFDRSDFARLHPGGSLGRRLAKVESRMRPLTVCRVASEALAVREVFAAVSRPGRRSGAILLVAPDGRLSGIFTDSDLARLFEARRDADLDLPIRLLMSPHPVSVPQGTLLTEAINLMAERKISELPVVDPQGRPLGLLDITDVLGMIPPEPLAARAGSAQTRRDLPAPHTLRRNPSSTIPETSTDLPLLDADAGLPSP
ncbi:MAG: KpsF/GutQ family sugar-phosphate isomerase [Pirellulales bacterium]|nr:KpsF/GutQ family sugar-phosphate isomerase [Pirellulales bacterium]